MDKDIELRQLKEQLTEVKAHNADLRDAADNKADNEEYEKEQQALSSIIDNNVDHHFVKTYQLKGKEVTVKCHAPSVIEQASVQNIVDKLTDGKYQGFAPNMQRLFLAIAYFQVVADEFPIDLSNLNKVYENNFILQVWSDYNDWLSHYLTPHYDHKKHPDWNPNFTPAINKLGGMRDLVRSNSGRNMWAIMKFFKVLPNDPLLKQLTFSQREFIIQSMNQDVKEAEKARNGQKTVSQFEDKSFEKKFYSNKPEKLLAPGDDLEDIYRQTLQMKAKEDAKRGISENYDKVLKNRIQTAYEEKMQQEKNAKAQMDDSWRKLLEESKNYHNDDG